MGRICFEKGTYVYVGSAQKNLEKRIQRHLKKSKKTFWHIDYLLAKESARVQKVFIMQGDKSAECALARKLAHKGDPVPKFGCSDCHCISHLIRLNVVSVEDLFSANGLYESRPQLGRYLREVLRESSRDEFVFQSSLMMT